MQTFIKDVIVDLHQKKVNISELTFVLPSKRAGVFLIHELSKYSEKTQFAPVIYSIEEFVEELSQLKKITNTELLFEFYTAYKNTYKDNVEPFEKFAKWAQILLQDFNEIDRYLIDQSKIFNYLKAIQEINSSHWSLDKEKSSLITNYLKFWNSLEKLYFNYKKHLLSKKIGYQGLIYREANENIELYIQENQNNKLIFLGFNALNQAEINIIQELLQQDIAKIYWDIDTSFISNKIHDAGFFIRQHQKWNYYNSHSFNWTHDFYTKDKNVSVIGIPKQVGQAKYIGELLLKLNKEQINFDSTAIILGDENLIYPMLTSIPKDVENVNITMGLPLKSTPFASFFNQLILLQKNNPKGYFYKEILNILSHPIISILLGSNTNEIKNVINKSNITKLSFQELLNFTSTSDSMIISLLFRPWQNNISIALDSISKLIYVLKSRLDKNNSNHKLLLEYLYKFNTVFNTIFKLNSKFSYIESIPALYDIYKEVLSTENLDFKGQQLKGLQIMGMLESRVLDFETVIISGVNEGILPAGKSNNSFIPFDVKIENGLPTYKEKDAVYTYHFYHLLQRAKNVFILYNTEPDILTGGEKSRFITQLEVEGVHDIKSSIVSPKTPKTISTLTSIKKTPSIIKRLEEIAKKGFSPSSLLTYIRNPIDFYHQRILGVYEYDEIEENVAANTMGTIVHNTLEDLYTPFIGKSLSISALKKMKPLVEASVAKHFKNEFKKGDFSKGKNLISFEISKRYIINFINSEITLLEKGNTITILSLESDTSIELNIPQLDFLVKLKGKIDRVDLFNNSTRIIDYKTGHVDPGNLYIYNWNEITTDYKKYNKSFQVLAYTLMLFNDNAISLPCESGIISLKKLSHGFMPFAKKSSPRNREKNTNIDIEVLESFKTELQKLILEIFNPSIDFNEKEV